MESSEYSSKWIMPPGLLGCAQQFEQLFKTIFDSSSDTKTMPIIIYGPRGSGKTLFTNIFVNFYRAKHPKIKKEQIVRLNIAALPQNLVESELFGYVDGAFTGARKGGKEGLVKRADGGVLILEEIGDLDKHVQAKLLMFIEYRLYYKVGGTDPIYAKDTQIVCTTNREPDQKDENGQRFFREDFMDRFECFALAPIHKRRGDVLYHLFEKFPDVVQSLQPYQVLGLLAYNWPGNVREIERIGRNLRMEARSPWRNPDQSGISGAMRFLPPPEARTSLNIFKVLTLEGSLRGGEVPMQTLERDLNKYGLGISTPNKVTLAFKKKQLEPIIKQDQENRFGVKCYEIEAFEKARDGFSNFYCPLFRQYAGEDKNLADVSDWDSSRQLPAAIEENYKDLADKILRFLHLSAMARTIPITSGSKNIFDMNLDELLRYYFKGLLDLNHGKTKAVAKQAGLRPSTCRDRLKRLGLTSKKANN